MLCAKSRAGGSAKSEESAAVTGKNEGYRRKQMGNRSRAAVRGSVVSHNCLFHGPAKTSSGLPRAKSIEWSALSPEQARGIGRLPTLLKDAAGICVHTAIVQKAVFVVLPVSRRL